MSSYTSSRSDIAKAKNLGASGHGSEHWLMQRVSAIIMSVLFIWFAYFCISSSGMRYKEVVEHLKLAHNFIPFILLIVTAFYHSSLGMQVVIEDYVSNLAVRYFLVLTLKIFAFVTVFTVLFSSIYFLIGG